MMIWDRGRDGSEALAFAASLLSSLLDDTRPVTEVLAGARVRRAAGRAEAPAPARPERALRAVDGQNGGSPGSCRRAVAGRAGTAPGAGARGPVHFRRGV